MKNTSVLCIGAGPAGLTAAYLLTKAGVSVTVVERDATHVGGISKTARYKGFYFDIGGHRFFSKSQEIEALWTEILGSDLLHRSRKSRIYYQGKLFEYPLRALDALRNLGVIEAIICISSYVRARAFPISQPRNFEEWVVNHFGRRLFEIFFKTYTEKVWGMKCTEISADWAAQRIKNLSLGRAVWHSVRRPNMKDRSQVIKTLIDSFRYPRRGPGMMWEAVAQTVRTNGNTVLLDMTVGKINQNDLTGQWRVTATDSGGIERAIVADHIISSMPIRDLVAALEPPPEEHVRRAAGALRYRDFIVVALIVKERNAFDDNWIYIHDPAVKVGRIQNFKSWSPDLVPDPALNCYGLEYFCFEHDDLWDRPDSELIALARREIVQLKLVDDADVVDGCVIRQPKAYPVYDDKYQANVDIVRTELGSRYPSLHLVGRNGMHKYNNQDHAMMTAMLTARNILAGETICDPWLVNEDAEYHEEASSIGDRLIPRQVSTTNQTGKLPSREN